MTIDKLIWTPEEITIHAKEEIAAERDSKKSKVSLAIRKNKVRQQKPVVVKEQT